MDYKIGVNEVKTYVIRYLSNQNTHFVNYFKKLEQGFINKLDGIDPVKNYVEKDNDGKGIILVDPESFRYLGKGKNEKFTVPDPLVPELNTLCSLKQENSMRYLRLCNATSKLLKEIAEPNGKVDFIKIVRAFPRYVAEQVLKEENYGLWEMTDFDKLVKELSEDGYVFSHNVNRIISDMKNDLDIISMNEVVYQ